MATLNGLPAIEVLQVALVSVYATSMLAKVIYWNEVIAWLNELVPTYPLRSVAAGLIVIEAIIPILVITTPWFGFIVSLVWILVASTVLLLKRKTSADCGCFGKRRPLGKGVAARNTVIALMSALGIWLAGGPYFAFTTPVGFVGFGIACAYIVVRETRDAMEAF